MTPAQARKTIKNLASAFSGGTEEIPSADQLLEAIEELRKRGGSNSSSYEASKPLSQSIPTINKQLVSDLQALSKSATQAQLTIREMNRLASSITTATGINVLKPRRGL